MLSFPGFLVQVQSFFKSNPIFAAALLWSSKFIFAVILLLSRAACAPSWLRNMAKRSNMSLQRQHCLEPR